MATNARAVSLRWTVPAITAGLLIAAVSVFGVVAYRAVRSSTLSATGERLRSAATQFAQISQPGAWIGDARAVAADPEVRALFGGTDPASKRAARRAMERLRPDSAPMLALEIRDLAGHVLLQAGRAPLSETLDFGPLPDSAWISPLRVQRERVAYQRSVPIRDTGHTVGHLVEVRTVTSNPVAIQRLSDLIGSDAVLLIGNADGSVWSDLSKAVNRPPPSPVTQWYVRDGRERLAATALFPGTPWVVAVESPQDVVLAPVQLLMRRFLALALLIIAVGVLAAGQLSRRITVPLTRLTGAAEAIAGGDLRGQSLEITSADEIGRLARAFAVMAASIRNSHDLLERQVEERTAELQRALTQLRDTQAELVRKEKLATLGQLSSSIGHELRNPLGVMTNALYYLELVLRDAPPRVREHVGIVQAQVRLSEAIISDLLDFTRGKPPQRAVIDVDRLIDEQLARIAVPPLVRVERHLAGHVPDIHGDPMQIGQVLVNLFTNAIQSMHGEAGVLSITARGSNGRVSLEVADTGHGISADHLDKIFEPLFTTRARGIGLGLAVARALARANDGDLRAANRVVGGAVFTLELPAVDASDVRIAAESGAAGAEVMGGP